MTRMARPENLPVRLAELVVIAVLKCAKCVAGFVDEIDGVRQLANRRERSRDGDGPKNHPAVCLSRLLGDEIRLPIEHASSCQVESHGETRIAQFVHHRLFGNCFWPKLVRRVVDDRNAPSAKQPVNRREAFLDGAIQGFDGIVGGPAFDQKMPPLRRLKRR